MALCLEDGWLSAVALSGFWGGSPRDAGSARGSVTQTGSRKAPEFSSGELFFEMGVTLPRFRPAGSSNPFGLEHERDVIATLTT